MPIKLEIGKKYICRNGAVVGPLEKRNGCEPYDFMHDFRGTNRQFGVSRVSWDENGVWHRDHPDNELDIVAEYHEYVWKWMVPDKPGVWMNAGFNKSPGSINAVMIQRPDLFTEPRWMCFLMDIPSIQMPPKQRVTKRLWLRHEESLPDDPGHSVYEEQWVPVGAMLDLSEGWMFTEKKKEFEE